MNTLHQQAETVLSSLYSGPVRKTAERVGLHPTVFAIHRRIQQFTKRIDHRRAPNPYPVNVGDRTVRFDISSLPEYNRVSSFLDEEGLIGTITGELRDDDVYWDVGANIGTHTFLPAAVHPDARVIAFEPHHKNVHKLVGNKALNDQNNVSIVPIALSDRSGTATLHGEDDSAGYGSFTLQDGGAERVAEVPVRPGDDVIDEGIPSPTLVKIDVEGGELAVLDGLRETLSTDTVRTAFCEVHRQEGVDEEEVERRFRTFGYDVSRIAERGPALFLRADRD